MKRLAVILLAVLAVGCGKGGGETDAGAVDAGPTLIPGFNPPPVPAGYTRYVTPIIDNLAPMDGTLWCQWLAGPATADVNVADVTGLQSKYGHHVVLYATTTTKDVGTSRPCTTADMLSIRFLGGIGGEGGSVSALPDHVVLQLKAGESLMANTHFLNLGDTPIQGQAVLDVKFSQPNAQDTVAGFFNNTATTFNVPVGQVGIFDRTCQINQDMNFFMFANHMHYWGTTATTTVDDGDGGNAQTLSDDSTWQAEEQFNPSWQRWGVAAPATVHAGQVMHTHCTWDNTTSSALSFPTEMCVGVGFYLMPDGGNAQDVYCVDGEWSFNAPP
ncbi:MAG: hypothetical protein JST54_34740 [Deltaproteobacteria bacterium]|nr:hypothetical protein [Deltaproteobacteria bacterium]